MSKVFRANIHIHSVLSPCGSLDMSPKTIINESLKCKYDFIGISDHNSTRQAAIIHRMAKAKGLYVLMGAEICTKEEVHCLVFVEDEQKLNALQEYIDAHLPNIPNKASLFGYQVVVDEDENIVYTENKSLNTALSVGIDELRQKVEDLDGIFIPAHVDRKSYGMFATLGFYNEELNAHALEIYWNSDTKTVRAQYGINSDVTLIKNGDSHFPENIKNGYSVYRMNAISFREIKNALLGIHGNSVNIET